MKKLEYTIEIAAKRDKVWKTMLEPATYQEWVAVSWPNSRYDGKWKQGEDIKFIGGEKNSGGTKANLVEVRQPEYLKANHIAVINGDGTEDSSSEIAKGWVGTTEEYFFTEKGDNTQLRVVINTNPDWESMFNEGWPNALKKLKEISERKAVTA